MQKMKKITQRNVKLIEEQEPNKLKAEIYRLRYEHSKLDKAKQLLSQQQEEIKSVSQYRQNLKAHMESFKDQERERKKQIQDQIESQKNQIAEKERPLAKVPLYSGPFIPKPTRRLAIETATVRSPPW